MKKIICIMLAMMLLAALGSAAFAADFETVGIRMELPEAEHGLVIAMPYGIISAGPDVYYMACYYLAMPQDEYDELNAKADTLSQEEMEECRNRILELCSVFVYEDSLDDVIDAQDDEMPEITEFGMADGLHFAYVAGQEDEAAAGLEPVYAEEYPRIREACLQALGNAELYAPEDPTAQVIGTAADFETTDLDGNPVSSRELFSGNEITMINYWGTWCHNCVEEMEELAAIHTRLQEKGCGIIGILQDGTDEEMIGKAKQIMEDNGTNYPNVLLDDSMLFLSSVTSFPTSFFVDREGTILSYPIAGQAVEQYEAVIDALLKGETVTTSAAPAAGANGESVYRVHVRDSDGRPVKGAMIQFCDDNTCSIGKTDADGVAEFDVPEGTVYTVHILKVPEGYLKTADEVRTLDVCSDVVIVVPNA